MLLSLFVGLLGLLLPVRFETVHASLLRVAADDTESVSDHAEIFLDFGKPGPASLLIDATASLGVPVQDQISKLEALEILYPGYYLSGGLDPFFEQFLKMLSLKGELATPSKQIPINRLLISSGHRKELLGYLNASSNQGVKSVLKTRSLTGVSRFMPVNSAAGAPLDTAILTTALLIQSGQCHTDWVVQLQRIARNALEGDVQAVGQLEDVYMAVLGSAQRMNWLQLAEWVRAFHNIDDFVQGTAWLRQSGENMSVVYAIAVVSEDTHAALTYRRSFGETGWEDMQQALALGKGALDYLLREQLPIYESPKWLEHLEGFRQEYPWVMRLVFDYPQAAQGLMFLLLGGAGFLLSLGVKGIFRPVERIEGVSVTGVFSNGVSGMVQHVGFAVLAVAAFILLNEPSILEQTLHEPGKLLLEFEISPQANIIEEETMPDPTIDQVTIVVLLIFLFVQIFIYSLCLFKLAQIKNTETTAELKLKLLDNEDVLFDMGLYVGLSGTVISLLMLAMGIVQASLVAAYASTLFGIIFVALLKVLHLRPLKRKYILQAAHDDLG